MVVSGRILETTQRTVHAVNVQESETGIRYDQYWRLLERSLRTGSTLESLLYTAFLPTGRLLLPLDAVVLSPGQVETAWRQSHSARALLSRGNFYFLTNQLTLEGTGLYELDVNGKPKGIDKDRFEELRTESWSRESRLGGKGPVGVRGRYLLSHGYLEFTADYKPNAVLPVLYYIPQPVQTDSEADIEAAKAGRRP